MIIMPDAPVDPNDVSILQQVQQLWSAGNQAAAIEALRPRAEAEVVWAVAMMSWLQAQQGFTGSNEYVDWAVRAAALGSPWQVSNVLNNLIANLPTMPHLVDRIPELLKWTVPGVAGVDLVSHGWNLLAQGQPDVALRVMSATTQWPLAEPQLATLAEQGRTRISELNKIINSAQDRRMAFEQAVSIASQEVDQARSELTTSAKQAGLLVTTVSSDATNALYKEDASRNEGQSKGAWRWGLIVLALAAVAAVLPVVLHYFNVGPAYSTFEVIGVHLASTAALGTFAGVLLARARARDHAAQRAYDLSTAMGTMISYSNQITNPVEKERFMMTMGQVIMQAHLSSGAGSKAGEDPMPGVLALANALRSTNVSGPAPTA